MSSFSRFPLTSYQRDIWVSESHGIPDSQFNVIFGEKLGPDVRLELLRSSLENVLKRNDAFSLRFDEEDGVPHQWVSDEDEGTPWVEFVDLSREPEPAAARAGWERESLARPFALRRARLFAAAILRESDDVAHLHLNAHHLIADAWALNQVSLQTWAEYDRLSAGNTAGDTAGETRPAAPSALTLVEADTAYRASDAYERDRSFHREALDGVVPALFARRTTGRGEDAPRRVRHTFTVEAELVRRIRRQGSSPFAFVSAVFAAYLARVHRAEEVVLGVPFRNRSGDAELATVGQRANSLPLRVPVGAGVTLRELAAGVRAQVDAVRPHERAALGDVLRDLPAGADGSRRLFDVVISYLRHPRPGPGRPALVVAPVHRQDALSVMISTSGDEQDLRVDLDGAGDVFDEDFPIGSVAAHLLTLLRNGLAEPDRPAALLPLLTEDERAALIDRGRGPAVPYASDRTVHGLVSEQAARTPDRVAITSADGSAPLTYGELDTLSDQVARELRAHGVGVEDRVAVLMERGPRLLVVLLGVLKAGGAYVPVDPGYPAERIAFLLKDSRAGVVLVDPGGAEPVVGDGVRVLRADTLTQGSHGPLEPLDASGATAPGATARTLAYVIYTSGSTGRPKGAMVEHHSVVNRLAWMQNRYPIGADDVLLQKTPISFDVSVWELFWWAIEGASLTLLPTGDQKDPRAIARTIAEQGVTTAHFVPSMLGPFLDLLEDSPEARRGVTSLRRVFASGEALPPARVEQFNRVFADGPGPAPKLVNLYGPTEATVDVTYHDCPSDPARPVGRVPIGRPIDNIQLYVRDAHGGLQPGGVPGELYIGGVGVARGYLDRPALTAEKFVEDPYTPGGRLYRTGDLARWLADGSVEYLGRIDGQVKIRGNRVELGEVQNRLASVSGVRDAVVVDHHSQARGTYLTAYYVADTELDAAAVIAELATLLPEFMIPAHLVRIDRVPLTPNGKADRRALPAPRTAGGPAGKHVAPRGATEETLAGVWADVLGLDTGSVGVHDDYFALGGDSITMLRVRAQAEKRGVHFSLTDLMSHPTVAGLAVRTTTGATGGDRRLAPFELVSGVDRARLEGREDAYPLTRLQLGLLYHSRAQEDSAVYHDVFQYTFTFDWDEETFRHSFARLVDRHPVLRSSFDLGGYSEPLQIVDTTVRGGLDIVDLRDGSEEDARAEISAHIEERRFHPYDFERAPLYLFRVHVLRDTVELVLSFHHAILDGGSVANLVRELLQDHLHGLGKDIEAVPDQALPSPAHHVLAERHALESAESQEFWSDYLTDAPLLRLEEFRPHEAPGTDELITRIVDLPDELTERLRGLARDRELPLKSVLFTAHTLALSLYSGTPDVTTGLVTHGRPEHEGAERIAGLFLNTMPVRLDTAAGTWAEVVQDAFRQEQRTYPHRRYPLSAVQEDLGVTVLETAFNYIHFRQLTEVFALPGVAMRDFRTWEETNFQLLVNAMTDPTDGRIRLRLDCHGRTFSPAQADLYADGFTAVLRRMTQHPDEPVDFGFLREGRPTAAPKGFAGPDSVGQDFTAQDSAGPDPTGQDSAGQDVTGPDSAAPDEPLDVVRAVEARTARAPDATALVSGAVSWTYAELGRASDRVARTLLALGARPGDRVGVALDRSPETIAVLLGVLKARAATVPLDTSYPVERLTDMVEQARPFRIITHADRAGRLGDGSTVLTVEDVLGGTGRGAPTAGGGTPSGATAAEDGTGPGGTEARRGTPAGGTEAGGDAVPLPAIAPEDTAYILFTSGSTGRPKGVAQPHRTLSRLVAWQNRVPSGVAGGVTAQYAPMSFDVSFQEIFSTLSGGGTLRILSEDERRDMPALLRLLEAERVERLCLPYVALQQLAEAADSLGLVPSHLKALLSSGEQLRVTDEIRRLCARVPGIILENQYGPTESHVVTTHTMTGDPALFPALPPIGRAIDGSRVHVLDARMRPVPVGVKGEIHLAGDCLADGYIGRPELTDERFVPDPFGAPGDRLYRTGDLGFTLPGGDIVCLGRADSQVKVRGYRVEPSEVELAITRFAAELPGLSEAAVVARSREGNDSFLAAFLVGGADEAGIGLLDKQLRTVLPEYMVPSHYEALDALPLTPSGKRDDAALRGMPLTVSDATDSTAPRDAYEQTLAEIVREQLRLPALGIHENFFDLGGTSLTAMRLVVVIEQRYGINVPLSEFVAAPTVAALAAKLRSGGATDEFDPLVPIRPNGTRRPMFFVHPMGGNVLCYVRFAKYLPDDQPFYALQAAGVDAGTDPLRSVEEIAASYIESIRRVQPHGPYVIGGWSFGGFVAFEIARQLKQAGEELQRLVLLDTTALNPGRRLTTDDNALLGWFFWELLWLQRGGDSPLELIPAELETLDEKFDFIAQLAIDEGVLPSGSTGAVVRRLFHVYEANWRAAFDYRPPTADQDMVLIRAKEPLPDVLHSMHTAIDSMHRDPYNGWGERTSGALDLVVVPGDHLTIMEEPYVAHMVTTITELIGH
ncbi:amino acid adenylation domain-containing protein [Streptomyces sp. DT24]|uniref:amino acid adenylation domain-containing protein n=1 Tax=Streptomyces sp. DT24 TaxID=3416520 RepID=UPI003CE8A10C